MTANHEHNGEDELQAARRTAHALGETQGAEAAEVAAEMAASPKIRQEVEAVEALAARLKEAAREASRPEPSPALREAIERRLAELAPAAGRAAAAGTPRPWWRSRMAAIALTVTCLMVVAPILWSINKLNPGKRRAANGMVATSGPELPDTFDIQDDAEYAPPADFTIDPTLGKPAQVAQEADSNDATGHLGQSVGGSTQTQRPFGGAAALGPGPRVTTSPGSRSAGNWSVDNDGDGVPDAAFSDLKPPTGVTVLNSNGDGSGSGNGSGDGQRYSLGMSYDPNSADAGAVIAVPSMGLAGALHDAMLDGRQQGANDTGKQDPGAKPRIVAWVSPTKTGSGVLALAASNSYSGGTDVTGRLQLGSGDGAGVGAGKDYGGGGSGFGLRGDRRGMLASGGGTKHTERACNAALVWLTTHQDPDGHWSLQHFTQQCKPVDTSCTGPGELHSDTAATAFGLLPFLAAGLTQNSRGPYKEHIRKGVEWLIHRQQPDGNLAKGEEQPMYSHGLAATALSEVYGLTGDVQVGQAAQRAVDFIVKSQNADGGWHENPKDPGDTSMVGWQVMALKSAHMAGLEIGDATFSHADKWLNSVAVNRGAEYSPWPGQQSTPEATATGLLCRQYLGTTRDDPILTGGMDYLMNRLPDERSPNMYYWYCATQVMHNMYGSEWDTWNRKMRDILVRSQVRSADQCANGSWAPEGDKSGKRGGRVVETALAALTLETYYRYLPLFKAQASARGPSLDVAVTPLKTSDVPKPDPKKPPTKPVETWKPAHAVPNSSRLMVGDREELPLKGMQVDVRIDGFRARVLLDLYYYNDRPQQLEGNFQLRLPDEASPYFFAFGRTVYQAPQVTSGDSMFFKPQQLSAGDTTPEKILALRGASWEQPKVARMVPKEKAAVAYRDTVRRRIDPALVEWSGAGVFQCRVFPLAQQSLHRVTIGYDVDLTRVGDDLELRLDLPGETPATIVDLSIAAADARQVSLDAPATPSVDGQRLSYRLVDPKDRPLDVRLRKPGTQMIVGNDEATGNYFATRVNLALPEIPAADRPQRAVFLVDTSLSAGPQFPLWTKLLRATLENNRDSIHEFAVEFFNVEAFWWQEKFVANTPENVDAVMNYADGLALEGATDLGRALKEAAAPGWQKPGAGKAADLFLLSDGAATWGEDRWAMLAAAVGGRGWGLGARGWGGEKAADSGEKNKNTLTPGPSPVPGEGRSEAGSSPVMGEGRSALFAYRTGLAGGDPRLLAYLAQETGGAVFSLVGEAELAAVSTAHRNRPWRLTGIEMAGAHDLLVAGRPQYVFPGQQLLVTGRLEQNLTDRSDRSDRSEPRSLVFTLQQGKACETVHLTMDQVLRSELAARTFGQVATTQLEDQAGAAAVEPVATAYARHFRITGRTCSLLMLESEQDYARFHIRPEEDSFVVKQQLAGPMVAKAVDAVAAALGDPKANFLAWYGRVRQSSEVHFDLPASLEIALEGLPAESFAVAIPPLACKLRLRRDLPAELQAPWQTGLPAYETLDAEAQRRLAAYGADDALRALSSLVELRPGDTALERDLAFSAIEWQRPGEAYHLLRRAAAARSFEPITFHALAHCLEQMGQADLAIVYYELACGGQWDARFGDMHNIAQLDYLRFLRRVADGRLKAALAGYAEARRATLAGMQLRDQADLATLIFWNTDGTDVDLHVTEPSGEECFFQHTQTASGGHISRDVTTGYGPELYLLPAAPQGSYRISAHYYAADANRASTRTKVLALVYENWGGKEERVVAKAVALTGRSESQPLATVKR